MTFAHRISAVTLIIVGLGLVGAAGADAAPRRDRQINRIERRIDRGVRFGALTRPEARRLHRGADRLEARARHFRADGHLSSRERHQLRHRTHHLSHRVTRLTHNRRCAR